MNSYYNIPRNVHDLRDGTERVFFIFFSFCLWSTKSLLRRTFFFFSNGRAVFRTRFAMTDLPQRPDHLCYDRVYIRTYHIYNVRQQTKYSHSYIVYTHNILYLISQLYYNVILGIFIHIYSTYIIVLGEHFIMCGGGV